MKLKSVLVMIAVFVCALSVQAQKEKPHFDVEQHHKQQAEFFTKELSLTDAEKETFLPLMQEYIHKRFELNKEVRNASRELRSKTTKASADYQKVIDLGLDAKIKEAELQKEYFKKFGKVLSAEKVYKYQKVERKFMERAVRAHRYEGDKKGK